MSHVSPCLFVGGIADGRREFLPTSKKRHTFAQFRHVDPRTAYLFPGERRISTIDLHKEFYIQTGVLAGIRVFTPEKARMSTRDVDRMLLEGYQSETKH